MIISPDKFYVCGIVGTVAAAIVGGWDGAMLTLSIFMAVDYLSGVVLAAVFKRSPKTATGSLESRAGLKGFFRKGGMLLIVIVAYRLDLTAGLNGVLRSGTIYALIANEALSILENIGLMGVPMPKALMQAVEQLRERADERVRIDAIEPLGDGPDEQPEAVEPPDENEDLTTT